MQRDHFTNAIHMTGDNMSAKTVGGLHRFFQIDSGTGLPLVNSRQAQGLHRDIGNKAVSGQLHRGEAGTVAGDTVTQLHIGKPQIAAANNQAHIATALFEAGDIANGTDNSCKHSL